MCNNCKLAACFTGPFKVLKHIGNLAYCIELPPFYSAFHNVFHVSQLKLYIPGGGDGTSINVQLVLVDGKEQYEVEKIMVERGCGSWVGYLDEHDLWLLGSKLAQAPYMLAAWKWQLGD